MVEELVSGILDEYDNNCDHYRDFIQTTKTLINDLLLQHNVQFFFIQDRLKSINSLTNKLVRKEYKYEKLKDITDICGIRIITYFSDTVDSVASIIKKEFAIDEKHSVDKRALLAPDRFGYLSLQYVAKLSKSRLKLTEHQRFSDCQIEIQIQSLLQHTWAEIQHNLGYKSEISVPKQIQRRFSQLAGLLELADDEFVRINNTLTKYKASLPRMISRTPKAVPIDQASILAYIETSSVLKNIENRIESSQKIRLREPGNTHSIIERCAYVGYNSIYDIDSSLIKFDSLISHIANNLVVSEEQEEEGYYTAGLSLFFLPYAHIASVGSIENILKFLDKFWGDDVSKEEKSSFAKELINWSKLTLP